MELVLWAWLFGAAFVNLTAGPVYVAFARKIGASDLVLGSLGAALPAMSFVQVFAARALARKGRPRRQMLIGGLIGRSLWIVAALMPLFAARFPHLLPQNLVLPLVVGTIVLSGIFQTFIGPAFFTWMTFLIPPRVRPSFLARRMQAGTLAALVIILLSGWIADRFPDLTVYGVVLALGAVAGVLDIACFFGVKEPPVLASFTQEPLPLGASLRQPLCEKPVRQFLMFVSVMMLSLGCTAPFLAVHSMEFLKLGKTQTSLLTIVAPLLGITLTSRFWGDIIGRSGNRPVLRFCSMCLVLVPAGWLLATPHNWIVLAVALFVSGSLFCAVELCNQNLISALSPHLSRGTISALFSICAGSSFALGSLGGGQIAQMLQGQAWHFGGMTFVNYHVLFLVSLLGRLVSAFLLAPHLEETTAAPTREMLRQTVRETVPEIARQTAQMVVNPPLLSPSSRRAIREKRQLRRMRRYGQRRKHAAQHSANKH